MTVHPYIDKRSIPEPNTGCWLWERAVDKDGYGAARHDGRGIRAHRMSYLVHTGPIPPGMLVCHRCDVPACVNPDHLVLGTPADNMADRGTRGRTSKPKGERNHRALFNEEDVRRIFAEAGTHAAIARRLGVSSTCVRLIKTGHSWRHLGLLPQPAKLGRNRRGEEMTHAKLTEQQAVAIFHDTRPQKAIARDYGVSRSTVSLIKQGRNWAHLRLRQAV